MLCEFYNVGNSASDLTTLDEINAAALHTHFIQTLQVRLDVVEDHDASTGSQH